MTQVFDGSLLENFTLVSLLTGLMFSSFKAMHAPKSDAVNTPASKDFFCPTDRGAFSQKDRFQSNLTDEMNTDKLYAPSEEVLSRIMNYARTGKKP